MDHFEKPRNVGSFDKNDPNVGTGLVGAPACGDVMKLQIKARARRCSVMRPGPLALSLSGPCECLAGGSLFLSSTATRPLQVDEKGNIIDSKFKTFGCGSAIASSSLATEWVKGRTIDDAVRSVSLPAAALDA